MKFRLAVTGVVAAALLVGFFVIRKSRHHGLAKPAVAGAAPSERHCKAENVIVMVMDGARFSETWGEPTRQYIPNLSSVLAKEGVVYPNFYNNGFTYTEPGHTAIMTGFYQNLKNNGTELPAHPSFMQIWLKQTGQDKSLAWVIASKAKLEVLADTTDSEWHGKFNPSTDCGMSGLNSENRDDAETLKVLLEKMSTKHPRLVLLNFKEPDVSGHQKNWVNYLRGIKNDDEYAEKIWEFIQSDPFYKDKTAFFVANDHGRHLDANGGYAAHGCDCDGCRHIMLFAAGPDFKKNVIETTKREQTDIPVTISQILGIKIPGAEGNAMKELYAP